MFDSPPTSPLRTLRIVLLELLVFASLENLVAISVFVVLVAILPAGVHRLNQTVDLVTDRFISIAARAKFVETVVIYR